MVVKSTTDKSLHRDLSLAETISSIDQNRKRKDRVRRKYKRKRIPESERELKSLRKRRQAEYEEIVNSTAGSPSIWSFESLFPEPVLDEETVRRDLYEVKERDESTLSSVFSRKQNKEQRTEEADDKKPTSPLGRMRSSFYGGSSMMRIWRDPKLRSPFLPDVVREDPKTEETSSSSSEKSKDKVEASATATQNDTSPILDAGKVDYDLTRMVEDRIYGYRRTKTGMFQYETSLVGDGAVQFRDGVRLGNPLRVNADRLNHLAKQEFRHGRVEEAQELYEQAVSIDPRDGRAYLGLSRCAERRRDFKLARKCLEAGIGNSASMAGDVPDRGANPFLLQALGRLEEKMGNLSEAEVLYILAVKSRPSHAAAWVSLAQLRTRKLGQSAKAGRACYQSAERELKNAGLEPSSHVYTAWAAMEYRKAGDTRTARELFKKALQVDPKCSAAWMQLGVMEVDCENWEEAQLCFDTVLKFDQRNSRVLQAYALMETKRPDGNSRKAIGLFERALKANRRDAGVLQAYALYVAELGDIDAARELLQRGTEVNKRHAPVWQAWGVLETRYGNAEDARNLFQQGIWACGQLTGSQSGGYHCARLWQAWGVLEAKEGQYAAARRCFSRALDANSRNVPAVTAWAQMEEKLGNHEDARMIYERALGRFAAGSDDKMSLWRSYELMEERHGDRDAAQAVYRRATKETIGIRDDATDQSASRHKSPSVDAMKEVLTKTEEVEVVRWQSSGGEVWMNGKEIESKLPYNMKKRQPRP